MLYRCLLRFGTEVSKKFRLLILLHPYHADFGKEGCGRLAVCIAMFDFTMKFLLDMLFFHGI